MNMRAAFPRAAGPQSALAEPVLVALAEGVSAVFLDGGKGAARGRLTCTLDGAPAPAPCLGTSLDLADGGCAIWRCSASRWRRCSTGGWRWRWTAGPWPWPTRPGSSRRCATRRRCWSG